MRVAVTGPTGELGRSFIRALDAAPEVERIIGMARRPRGPRARRRPTYRQGDVLSFNDVEALARDADVLVHLAFIILGGREETRTVNLTGSRNVFAAAVAARAAARLHLVRRRLRLPRRQPAAADRGRPPARQRALLLLGAEGRARAGARGGDRGRGVETYVLRPCIVAGPDAQLLLRQLPPRPLPLPDPGTPFQLVHHDDVADALVAATLGPARPAPTTSPATGRSRWATSPRRSGRHAFPVPRILLGPASLAARAPLVPTLAQWVNAGRVPVVMDTAKARRELGWRPRYSSREILGELVSSQT